MPENVLRSPAI